MNLVKKISIIFLSILTVLGTFIVPVAAANITSYDISDVERDLSYVRKPNGEAFNFDDYPRDSYHEPELISVNEYGYSANRNQVDNYSLYFYVYTGGIRLAEEGSTFSFEASFDFQTYFKPFTYNLNLIDISEDGYFAKFKLEVPDEVYVFFKGSTKRYYKITKLNLCFSGEVYGNEYYKELTLDYKYCFSGEKKNKVVQMQNSQLIPLELHDSVYKTKTSPTGENYRKAIYTCYFAVPNEYFEQYDALTGIRCGWTEKTTGNMFFTDDYEIYKEISANVLGRVLEYDKYTNTSTYLSNLPSIMYGELRHHINNSGLYIRETIHSKWGWNTKPNISDILDPKDYNTDFIVTGPYSDIFKVNEYDLSSTIDGGFIYEFTRSDLDKIKYSFVAPYQEFIFYDTDVLNVESRYNNDRWKQFWDGWLFNVDEFEGQVNTIVKLQDSDLFAYESGEDADNYDLCKNLLIAEHDIHGFYDDYKEAETNDESLILFRFAVRDCYEADAYYYSPYSENEYWDNLMVGNYVIFDNFDIIWLEFTKDGLTYIHPVEAESITISPDVTPPYDREENIKEGIENIKDAVDDFFKKGNEKLDALLKIFSAICVVIIILVFWKPIVFVLNKVIEFFKWLFKKRKKNE